jgi:thioredoxin-dependent adenylylsulfate APS reductase
VTAAVEDLDFERMAADEVMEWTYATMENVALVASFQAESLVLIDIASRLVPRPRVITLDTGRLPEETHGYIQAIRERYDIALEVRHPEPADLARVVDVHGPNLFRESVELRQLCCEVRKVRPLKRALEGADAWVTGLRRDQTASRRSTPAVALDPVHGGIVKVAPLVTWSRSDVWTYLEERGIEPHPLYGRGYASIGCAPCTRPTAEDEDERAGRWWWERDAPKECGLHWSDD